MKLLLFMIAGFIMGFVVDKFRWLAITLVIGAVMVPAILMATLYTMDDVVVMTFPWPIVCYIGAIIVGHICYIINEQKKGKKGN